MSFSHLKLIPPIIQILADSSYNKPTPIQEKAIPIILDGRDIMAAAQTGTGKTAAFSLPLLQILEKEDKAKANKVRALIITPTRELAAQVNDNITKYSQYLNISNYVVFGGVKINPQMQRLRRGVDILVATPGRLLDLMEKNAVNLSETNYLVLDEADRMLDMGFLPDVKKILKKLPEKRQSLLFSATFPKEIESLCNSLLNNPVSIATHSKNSTAKTVKQWMHPVDKKRKSALLSYLIGHNRWQQVLVFVRTKRGANKIAYDLQKSGLTAEAIHGDKSQGARTRVLKMFKTGEIKILVATDIAARGLDIEQLPQVINLDLPNVAEDYVHRIGRTGRAGSRGQAISLVSADEVDSLQAIENLIRQKLKREFVDGFEPNHTVPETVLSSKLKIKKPHKKKLAKQAERDKEEKKRQSIKSNKRRTTKRAIRNKTKVKKQTSSRKRNNRPAKTK